MLLQNFIPMGAIPAMRIHVDMFPIPDYERIEPMPHWSGTLAMILALCVLVGAGCRTPTISPSSSGAEDMTMLFYADGDL
jgi:hypothetical protein